MLGAETDFMDDQGTVIRFFNQLLREKSPCHLKDEYPLVFGDSQLQYIALDGGDAEVCLSSSEPSLLYVEETGIIKAGLACLPRKVLLADGESANFLFVGSVVTHPDFRQQGLQKYLFDKLFEACQQLNFSGIILWSNQLSFYEKLNFFLGGLQATWSSEMNQELSNKVEDVHFELAKDVAFNKNWFDRFQEKVLRVDRSLEEFERLLKIPYMKIAYTNNAYVLMGKGEDFKFICHEWAGPSDEVLSCLEKIRRDQKKLFILSPGVMRTSDEIAVCKVLEARGYEARLEYLGLFKTCDPRFSKESLDPQSLKFPFFIWGLDSI